MNILVCVKQVPDNAVVPTLDPATNRVVTQGVETMVSPFDADLGFTWVCPYLIKNLYCETGFPVYADRRIKHEYSGMCQAGTG